VRRTAPLVTASATSRDESFAHGRIVQPGRPPIIAETRPSVSAKLFKLVEQASSRRSEFAVARIAATTPEGTMKGSKKRDRKEEEPLSKKAAKLPRMLQDGNSAPYFEDDPEDIEDDVVTQDDLRRFMETDREFLAMIRYYGKLRRAMVRRIRSEAHVEGGPLQVVVQPLSADVTGWMWVERALSATHPLYLTDECDGPYFHIHVKERKGKSSPPGPNPSRPHDKRLGKRQPNKHGFEGAASM